MDGFAIWHWSILMMLLILSIVPAWRIVSKAGYPGVLSLLLLVPMVNIAAVWVFAFVRWPYERTKG